MAKKRTYQDDDGRTIADMSGVGPSPMLFPRMPKKATPQEPSPADDRPWESQEQFTPEQRRAAMGGALKAAMLIAGVFIAAGAVAILAMQLIWNHGRKNTAALTAVFFFCARKQGTDCKQRGQCFCGHGGSR